MKFQRLLPACLCLFVSPAYAYSVRGTLGHLGSCYHPRVYLEVVKDIGDFYAANSSNLIAASDVAADGSFLLTGKDLPAEKLFYRLYATQSPGVKTYIMNGANPNFILLALDNTTEETIICGDFCTASAVYTASTRDNGLLAQIGLQRSKHITEATADISESKLGFLSSSYKQQMLRFADTSNSVAAFYAAFLADVRGSELSDLAAVFNSRFPHSVYAGQLAKMAELDGLPSAAGRSKILNVILGSLLLISVIANVMLLVRRKKAVVHNATAEQQAKELIESLSIKEREILKMLHAGLSNKEIADKHNIEVSTVKTHVSRIYQKTGIRNRKEVASIARYA